MVRISTSMIHNNAVTAMMRRQTELSRTQTELASGLRIQKPSDNPSAAVRILQLEKEQAAAGQYGTNITSAKSRLSLEEQALADADSIVQRVNELAIQANSAALADADRSSISSELMQLNKQLVDIANRKDSNGEFLFSGYSSSVQPFARDTGGTVTYSGDQATRNLQVGASQYIQDGDSGFDVFLKVPEGNGTFVTGAASTNTGTGVIAGAVQDISAWAPDDYTLSFTSANAWQITDSSSNVVSSGAYTAGTAIAFNGIQVTVTGAPAAGDSFSVARSRSKDIFSTIDDLANALNSPQGDQASRAKFQNQINEALAQLDQSESHLLNVRAGVGARLSMLETTDSSREDSISQITSSLSSLRDVDTAEATSRLSQQYTGLQAAQLSYAKIAQLSLFSYL